MSPFLYMSYQLYGKGLEITNTATKPLVSARDKPRSATIATAGSKEDWRRRAAWSGKNVMAKGVDQWEAAKAAQRGNRQIRRCTCRPFIYHCFYGRHIQSQDDTTTI